MSTRTNVVVVEKNGDWGRTTMFYRHCDGYLEVTGKELGVFAYMAKNHSEPDKYTDDDGNEVIRENFKRIRNRFMGYLEDTGSYENEGEVADGELYEKIHGDIEFLYLVNIERKEAGDVQITVDFVETPVGIEYEDFTSRIDQLMNGQGTEIKLQVK